MDKAIRPFGLNDLRLLEQLFEQLPESPFFVKDRSLRYVAANAAMARLCGARSAPELYGRRASAFFPANLARHYERLDEQVLASGDGLSNRLELSAGEGAAPTWLIFSRVPVRADDGAIVGVAAAARTLRTGESRAAVYPRLARVAQRLRERSDQPLRLSELAAMAGLSSSQLERDFTRLFGLTPSAFLQKARLEKALRLLETDLSIAAVAYECGYADHSAFTRRFGAVIGTSPSRYRTLLRGRGRKGRMITA